MKYIWELFKKKMSQKRSARSKNSKKAFWKLTLIMGVLLIVVAGIGTYYYDQGVRKQNIAYEKQVNEAKEAKDKAYNSRKTSDINEAKKLILKLHEKDKSSLNQSITQLLAYLTDIDKVSQLVAKVHQNITEDTIKEAEQGLELLNASYEKTDKEKFAQQLAADKQVLVEQQKEAERIADEKNKLANQKLIALTFDDGPNPATTPQLLKTLSAAKVPATFFALGKEAQQYPDIIKEESDLGNEVASHTWDHKDLVTLSPAQQKQEIESANQLINKITGKNVTLFRPPYGSYNNSVLCQTDLTAVNWSVDTNDWRYRTSAPVVQNVATCAHDGAIILMHDIHQWSVDAVPQIIQNLKAQGYTFVTVSTLLDLRNGGAKAQQVYFGR